MADKKVIYEEMNKEALRAACVARGVKTRNAGGKLKTVVELREDLKRLDEKDKGPRKKCVE